VKIPPPLLFVAGLLGGWLLHRGIPLQLLPVSRHDFLAGFALGLGWALIAGSFAFMCWALLAFRRAGTTVVPTRPAGALVESGPYRRTRNPMYVGMTGIYLGVNILLNSWWPLLFLPVVLFILRRAVIDREERYLRGAFGAAYDDYCRRVHRWL
jgi:protein-S-isoprenylcysteine O-methyltransferase Ste14